MNTTDNIATYTPEVIKLPFPADYEDEPYTSIAKRAEAMLGAADTIFQHATSTGQEITISEDDRLTSRSVFDGTTSPAAIRTTAEAIHLTALLNAYDITVVQSAQQLRNFCTNILIDRAATAPKDSDRLRAVEMIGKIKDVALFEERSTVLVANMTTDQIKKNLLDKLATLRSKVTDATTIDAKEVA